MELPGADIQYHPKRLLGASDIKNEKPDIAFEGVDIDSKIKCGEVFASYGGLWSLICAFCYEEFDTLNLFGDHIRKKHECQMEWPDNQMCRIEVSPLQTKLESDDCVSDNDANLTAIETKAEISVDNNENPVKKPFSCDLCHRKYKTNKNLRRHQLSGKCKGQLSGKCKDQIFGKCKDQLSGKCKDELENVATTNEPNEGISHELENNINDLKNETNELIIKDDSNGNSSINEFQNMLDKNESDSQNTNLDEDDESFTPPESDNEECDAKPYSCDVCHRSFKYRRSLVRHKKKPEACKVVPSIFCIPCNRQLSSKRTFYRHQKLHGLTQSIKKEKSVEIKTERLEYHCDICNSYFKTKHNLQNHSDVHETLPTTLKDNLDFLKCKYCYQMFDKLSKRKQCESTHTSDRPFKCPHCERTFLSNYDRKLHIRIHTGEGIYQCEHCPKICTNSTDMKRHTERHTNIRKFGCNLCDKRFYRRFELTRHMRTHTKERPYVCEDCGATYPVLAQLKDHQLRHTGVKNIKCEICGRLFYSKSVLKVHLPTHFDEKPFECDVCGRKFSRAKAMQKHQKLHSGIKKYVCNICGKAYAQDSGLYAHKKSHGANISSERTLD